MEVYFELNAYCQKYPTKSDPSPLNGIQTVIVRFKNEEAAEHSQLANGFADIVAEFNAGLSRGWYFDPEDCSINGQRRLNKDEADQFDYVIIE